MAILTDDDLVPSRRSCSEGENPDWDKGTINAALQAMEDWYNDEKLTVSALVDTATSPYVFSNPMKKKIGKYWMRRKWGTE